MSGYIGPATDAVIDGIIKELKKKQTKEKVMKNIIDPLLCDMSSRYYPYFMMITVILIIIIVLLISILGMTVINANKCQI
jgi:pyridoxal/pyridoxine/pyridoxamine kinase